jgi:hypothetical protein
MDLILKNAARCGRPLAGLFPVHQVCKVADVNLLVVQSAGDDLAARFGWLVVGGVEGKIRCHCVPVGGYGYSFQRLQAFRLSNVSGMSF